MEWYFHRRAVELLEIAPSRSSETISALSTLEQKLGRHLPAALREWYSLPAAPFILQQCSIVHRAIPLPELGQFLHYSEQYGWLLPFLLESTGVWRLAVSLTADDPSVLIGYDEDNGFEWLLHAHCFSDSVLAAAWDGLYYVPEYRRGYGAAMVQTVSGEDLERLAAEFEVGPTTYVASGYFKYDRCLRFWRRDQRITVMLAAATATLFLAADSVASMNELLDLQWSWGSARGYFRDKNEDIYMPEVRRRKMKQRR